MQVNNYTASALLPPPFDAIVIASSTGGVEALKEIASSLPADFPVPVVVAHHLSADYPSSLVEILAKRAKLGASWAEDGLRMKRGNIYIAPPGCHIEIARDGKLSLSKGPKIRFVRPSADLLFKSAASVYKDRTIGIVLSGMGEDGAEGAQTIKQAGGRIIVQAPGACRSWHMPRAAFAAGVVDFVLPIERISSALVALCMVLGGAGLFYVPPSYKEHLPAEAGLWWPQPYWSNALCG